MQKKTIELINYEGLKSYPTDLVGWSDTWIRFNQGRRKVKMGPCILGLANVRADDVIYAGMTDHVPWVEPDGDWSFAWYDDNDKTSGIPNIVVNKQHINKRDIEQAIEWMLIERFGFKTPLRFRWRSMPYLYTATG